MAGVGEVSESDTGCLSFGDVVFVVFVAAGRPGGCGVGDPARRGRVFRRGSAFLCAVAPASAIMSETEPRSANNTEPCSALQGGQERETAVDDGSPNATGPTDATDVPDTAGSTGAAGSRRKDVRRNQQALLDAAGAAFVAAGVDAPVRDIAARAGVGVGTVYRHFPTRADLVIAVYRHQVDACAEAGPALLSTGPTPGAALVRWVDLFVDFLVTKHGLAAAMRGEGTGFEALHAYFLDRLLPVCAELIDAAVASGEIRADLDAYHLMRGIGNLCVGAESDPRYDPRRLVAVLLTGLRRPT